MQYVEIPQPKLFDMPYLQAGQIDWGLQDPVKNARRVQLILHSPHVIVRTDQDGKLCRRQRLNGNGGEFAYIGHEDGLIAYFMEYKRTQRQDFGSCATQVKVWRTIAAGTEGLAKDIFFDVMLTEFDTMISDRIQTDDGRRFWLQRMTSAISRGMEVGLLDHETPMPYPKTGWRAWLSKVDGWGKEVKHHERLFYISRRPGN